MSQAIEPTCKEIADVLRATKSFIEKLCGKNDIRVKQINDLISTFSRKNISFADYIFEIKNPKNSKPTKTKPLRRKSKSKREFVVSENVIRDFLSQKNGDFVQEWIKKRKLTQQQLIELVKDINGISITGSKADILDSIIDYFNYKRHSELDNKY